MLKKIVGSKWVRVLFSVVLIYFAFKKVNVMELFRQLAGISIWFVLASICLSLLSSVLISYRWSLLLIKGPKVKDVLVFIKSSLAASFYGLFFPSAVAGDVLKWVIIDEKYPEIPKTKLLGSIVLDRFVGMSMFMFSGTVMLLVARFRGVTIPWLVELLFWGVFLGCMVFYLLLASGGLSKIFKFKWFKKFENVAELVEKDNVKQVFKCVMDSFESELFWILQKWFFSWYFNAGLSIMSIFIFLPVISMILVLPISFAGFGAREQLYLFFFGSMARSPESLLLTSTFSGILGVLLSLIGGLVTLTPDFKKTVGKGKNKK